MENKTKALEYLNIPRSSFYYLPILDSKDAALKTKIEKVMLAHASYGHKRIAWELGLNKKPILRVMKKFGLKPFRRRKRPKKSSQNKAAAPVPNLLASLRAACKNHIWATDFTYIWWRGRFLYLCTVIDLFTREVVGVSVKTNHSALLVAEALLNALQNNPPPAVIHSDQGSEYKSKLFRSILFDFKIQQSMSKKGSPWQNGFQESFYGNWNVDVGDFNRFASLGELTAEIYKSIYYYNHLRIHTAFRCPPKQFASRSEIKYNTNQEILAV